MFKSQIMTAEIKKESPDFDILSAAAQCIQFSPAFLTSSDEVNNEMTSFTYLKCTSKLLIRMYTHV